MKNQMLNDPCPHCGGRVGHRFNCPTLRRRLPGWGSWTKREDED